MIDEKTSSDLVTHYFLHESGDILEATAVMFPQSKAGKLSQLGCYHDTSFCPKRRTWIGRTKLRTEHFPSTIGILKIDGFLLYNETVDPFFISNEYINKHFEYLGAL